MCPLCLMVGANDTVTNRIRINCNHTGLPLFVDGVLVASGRGAFSDGGVDGRTSVADRFESYVLELASNALSVLSYTNAHMMIISCGFTL
jgi:hypothetical protein